MKWWWSLSITACAVSTLAAAQSRGAMGKQAMADDMSMSMPNSIVLTGSSVSKKHFGRKVSVTGGVTMEPADAMGHQTSTLAVRSVKVVGQSCS